MKLRFDLAEITKQQEDTTQALNLDIFIEALKTNDEKAIIKLFVDNDIDAPLSNSDFTPLVAAIIQKNLPAVKLLLECGANVDAVHNQSTALIHAIKTSQIEMVNCILDAGASCTIARNGSCESIIEDCAAESSVSIFNELIEHIKEKSQIHHHSLLEIGKTVIKLKDHISIIIENIECELTLSRLLICAVEKNADHCAKVILSKLKNIQTNDFSFYLNHMGRGTYISGGLLFLAASKNHIDVAKILLTDVRFHVNDTAIIHSSGFGSCEKKISLLTFCALHFEVNLSEFAQCLLAHPDIDVNVTSPLDVMNSELTGLLLLHDDTDINAQFKDYELTSRINEIRGSHPTILDAKLLTMKLKESNLTQEDHCELIRKVYSTHELMLYNNVINTLIKYEKNIASLKEEDQVIMSNRLSMLLQSMIQLKIKSDLMRELYSVLGNFAYTHPEFNPHHEIAYLFFNQAKQDESINRLHASCILKLSDHSDEDSPRDKSPTLSEMLTDDQQQHWVFNAHARAFLYLCGLRTQTKTVSEKFISISYSVHKDKLRLISEICDCLYAIDDETTVEEVLQKFYDIAKIKPPACTSTQLLANSLSAVLQIDCTRSECNETFEPNQSDCSGLRK